MSDPIIKAELPEFVVGTPMRVYSYPSDRYRGCEPKVIHPSVNLMWEGKMIARAKYLEYHVHGESSSPWPVVWTRKKCIIYLPPADGQMVIFYKNAVRHANSWDVPRAQGIWALSQVWDSMHHIGHIPTLGERHSTTYVGAVRLNPASFDVVTPIVDNNDDAQDTAHEVVIEHPSSPTSGVHLRMPPSGHVAAGTKWASAPGGSYPPWVTAWLVDSGCPLDLLDRMHVQGCLDSVCDGSKVTLATANGDTVSSEVSRCSSTN